MKRQFVIESVLVAIYGELLLPSRPVEYLVPYSSVMELYEMRDSGEAVMPELDDDAHVKRIIGDLIDFFEEPLNKKKIERALVAPWRKSPPLLVNDNVSFTVVNASENAQYGEWLDPIETELVLTSLREQAPMITDQLELQDKIIEGEIPVQVYDIEDFEYAVEEEIAEEDWKTP